MTTTIENSEQLLAERFIEETGHNVFLTGKAGTGKTTFLHNLKKNNLKRMVVTAPTGVAAINATGVTLHSFFQLPFSPFAPGSKTTQKFRMSREKKNIIKCLDLLVIDEISMVRADLLDAVDDCLRRIRRNPLPFGGVQLLMIGDLFQLPPVVKNEERALLKATYATPYFFSSKALEQTGMVTVELRKIYRQSDSTFINILNQVRNNQINDDLLQKLNTRVIEISEKKLSGGTITLCTHNSQADRMNQAEMDNLSSTPISFQASVQGEFPESTYPGPEYLELKEGSQVMFTRNDSSIDKRFFNGKIGTILKIDADLIRVKCPGDNSTIDVEPATWENIEYSLDTETEEIIEKRKGAFSQYPLRLAWAITIHKSQGLTFDKAVIDAQSAFAHGQVYVALSRCRSLEGLSLLSPVSTKAIMTDVAITQFNRSVSQCPPTLDDLHEARIGYEQTLLMDCFNFQLLQSSLNWLISFFNKNNQVLHIPGDTNWQSLQVDAEREIFRVGLNFQNELYGLFTDSEIPSTNKRVKERLSKASDYFIEKINSILTQPAKNLKIETDNKVLGKTFRRIHEQLLEGIALKSAAASSCKDDFSPRKYFRALSEASVEKPKQKSKVDKIEHSYIESDISHPALFKELKEWRTEKAKDENVASFQVFHQKTLIQVAIHMPATLLDLQKIKGIGAKKSEKYGEELLKLVSAYKENNDIPDQSEPIEQKTDKPKEKKTNSSQNEKKVPTLDLTLLLLQQGLSADEIAKNRNLALQTVEKHIATLIELRKVEAQTVISPKRLSSLSKEIIDIQEMRLKEIKEQITGEASWAEIKYVLAHINSNKE